MSSESDNKETRKFTSRTDENKFNYKMNTFHHFQPELFRIEFQSSQADRLIYCYDHVTLKTNFDVKSGLNCLKKYQQSENTY